MQPGHSQVGQRSCAQMSWSWPRRKVGKSPVLSFETSMFKTNAWQKNERITEETLDSANHASFNVEVGMDAVKQSEKKQCTELIK